MNCTFERYEKYKLKSGTKFYAPVLKIGNKVRYPRKFAFKRANDAVAYGKLLTERYHRFCRNLEPGE